MTPLAETRSIDKTFGDSRAVDGVDITVTAGETVGLVGANGAGKTTLIRMLLGLIAPDRGQALLFGAAPDRHSRRRIGYMPQGLGLYEDLTVRENLSFVGRVYGVTAPPLEGDLAAVADTPVADLPLGLRRRTGFLAALSHRPELLVLDEPTSGVGPLGRAELWENIHGAVDAGSGALVTTHYMDEAEQCDRLVFLGSGRVVASGTVEEIVAGKHTVEATPPDPIAALDALEQFGLPALPSAGRLRLPGASLPAVQAVLGASTALEETPSSLEEAFMTLAAAS